MEQTRFAVRQWQRLHLPWFSPHCVVPASQLIHTMRQSRYRSYPKSLHTIQFHPCPSISSSRKHRAQPQEVKLNLFFKLKLILHNIRQGTPIQNSPFCDSSFCAMNDVSVLVLAYSNSFTGSVLYIFMIFALLPMLSKE